jgi:hypothetical protein
MVIGGAVFQDGLFSLALGLLGHPAATAALSAAAWALEVALALAAVVDVLDAFFGPPPLVTATEMPMMMARATTTKIVLRISCFRFLAFAAAALLASRPAF